MLDGLPERVDVEHLGGARELEVGEVDEGRHGLDALGGLGEGFLHLRGLEVQGGSGLERDRRRPDRWLEIARAESSLGPARGRYEARWDGAHRLFDHVASELSFELRTSFGEGKKTFPGVVKLERKLKVEIGR